MSYPISHAPKSGAATIPPPIATTTMSTNYTTENPRRSSRGGRRRSRRGGGNRSNETNNSSNSSSTSRNRGQAPRAPKKLSFWEKIVSFFTGGSKAKPASTPRKAEAPAKTAAAPKAERKPRTGMRKPEAVEVTSPRLYVGNLSFDAAESDLFELFNGVGIVQNVEVVCNRQTQRSKGFAFVQMQTVEEARRAVNELHDKEYMGRKLVVSGAKAVERREDREERDEQSLQPEQ